MNVNGKYLKDETGSIISPVVSTTTSYHGTTQLSTIIDKCATYTSLFEGSTRDDITLTQSAADFDILRIFWYASYDSARYRQCTDIYSPDGMNVSLNLTYAPSNHENIYLAYRLISISGTTVSNIRVATFQIGNSMTWTPYYALGNNVIPIYKIIGVNIGK